MRRVSRGKSSGKVALKVGSSMAYVKAFNAVLTNPEKDAYSTAGVAMSTGKPWLLRPTATERLVSYVRGASVLRRPTPQRLARPFPGEAVGARPPPDEVEPEAIVGDRCNVGDRLITMAWVLAISSGDTGPTTPNTYRCNTLKASCTNRDVAWHACAISFPTACAVSTVRICSSTDRYAWAASVSNRSKGGSAMTRSSGTRSSACWNASRRRNDKSMSMPRAWVAMVSNADSKCVTAIGGMTPCSFA
mmetsp:Transcript_6902/g.15248  ORF Transcript_6902/g.15248 Transcript_6902/m.15248 type:complete len:247 (+) Transcript_6902:687-1427(+)